MPESFSGSLKSQGMFAYYRWPPRNALDALVQGASPQALAESQAEYRESGAFAPEWDIQLGRAQLGHSTSVVQAGQGPSFQTGNYAEALALAQGMKRSTIARGLYYDPDDADAAALERENVPWYAGYDESTRAKSLQGGQETFLTPAGAGAVPIGGTKLDPSGKDISQQRTPATREANLAPLTPESQGFYSGQEAHAWHRDRYGHIISPTAGASPEYDPEPGSWWRQLGGLPLASPGTRRIARVDAQSLSEEDRKRRRLAEEEEARTAPRAGLGASLQPTALGG